MNFWENHRWSIMDWSLSELKNKLKEKGLKLTTQRRAVLEIMQKHNGQHLTAEEIYSKVKEICPEIGLATVYRTIQLLEEMKLVERLSLDDGFNRYEIANGNNDHHHHHLICEYCGKIIEVEEDLMDAIEKQIEAQYKFTVTGHKVKFYGYCQSCEMK